jgi:hypothetical protein
MHIRDYINILEAASDMSYPQAVNVFARYGVPEPGKLNLDDLSDARKRLMKQHHPDIGGSHDAMALINSAFDTLKQGNGNRSSYRPEPEPDEDTTWAMAGYSGGMRDSAHISRQDYSDMNYIKKRMWELSGHKLQEWTIYGFDGAFLRNSLTVYGSPEIFAEMAKAMIIWQTKGGNSYPCRAVLVNRRREQRYFIIWADGRFYDKRPTEVECDSFNGYPGNDPQFRHRLSKLLDQLDENDGPLPDQPDLNANGYTHRTNEAIDVGDTVAHSKYGTGTVINLSVRRGICRVNFNGENRNVKLDSLRKVQTR